MVTLIAGLIVIVATIITFWAMMPRDGNTHRLVGTAWESYVNVAFTAAVALGVTMIVSGAIDVWAPKDSKATGRAPIGGKK